MYSTNGEEMTGRVLHPLVQLFRDELSAVHLAVLEPASLHRAVDKSVRETCWKVLRCAIACKALQHKSAEERDYRWSHSAFSFNDMMCILEHIHCRGTKKVRKSVINAIEERINSKALRRRGCEPLSLTCEYPIIVGLMEQILKLCVSDMAFSSSPFRDEEGRQSSKMQDNELFDREEFCQTPVISLEEDGPELDISEGSFFKAVREILEEQADDFSITDCNDDISEEEYNQIVASTSHDTDEAASEIVRIIMEELKLETGGPPKSESEAETSSWKKVENKIRVFFVDKFAKKSILSIVAKLRRKFDCLLPNDQMAPLKPLIMGVGCLVEDLIQAVDNQERRQDIDEGCFYERIAMDIAGGQQETIAKQLGDVVFHHLKPGKESKTHILVEIRAEMDAFMELMCKWLHHQAQQYENGVDLASVSLKEIRSNLPALTEAPLQKKMDAIESLFTVEVSPITDESAIRDEASEARSTQDPQHPFKMYDKLCEIVASCLVGRIMDDWPSNPSYHSAIMKLKEMLIAEMADSETVVQPKQRHVEKAVKAVLNDLISRTGNPEMMQIKLMTQDEMFYRYIAKSLKMKLVPQRRSIKKIFRSAFRSVVRVFTVCCTGHYPYDWEA